MGVDSGNPQGISCGALSGFYLVRCNLERVQVRWCPLVSSIHGSGPAPWSSPLRKEEEAEKEEDAELTAVINLAPGRCGNYIL